MDPAFLHTSWQLHDGGNLEHALGGWWNIPVLDVEDQDAFIQAKVLDLIRNLREAPGAPVTLLKKTTVNFQALCLGLCSKPGSADTTVDGLRRGTPAAARRRPPTGS